MSAQGPIRAAESTRADWRTPDNFYQWLTGMFHFRVDVGASANNAKETRYIDEAMDAIGMLPWRCHFADIHDDEMRTFSNPPFGDLLPWAQRFSIESRAGWMVVSLLPANTDTRWFTHCWETASEIWFLTPRVSFIDPETEMPIKGNTTGSMVVIWRPDRLRGGYPPVVRHLDWRKEVDR